MSSYVDNRNWSDKFMPHIKQLIGPHLLDEAPIEEDRNHNTDLTVLRMQTTRIACRVRTSWYAKSYRFDITLRSRTATGDRSELHKVAQGWGDLMFYGFAADDSGNQIGCWVLGDLNALRGWMHQHTVRHGRLPGTTNTNYDGTMFQAFDYREIPDFVMAVGDTMAPSLFDP
jgi:hypothetical protein